MLQTMFSAADYVMYSVYSFLLRMLLLTLYTANDSGLLLTVYCS